jgi:UPF0176 protein
MMPENNVLRCLSMLMRKSQSTRFRNELFLAWNSLEVLGRIYVSQWGINELSLPADNFYAFQIRLKFMISVKESIEYRRRTRRSLVLKLTVKVRDKIVADGLVDETFDVTNIWNSLGGELEDQIRL